MLFSDADDHHVVSMDADTATPTHFVERHIDPTYDWNEWSLRRKALQLVFILRVIMVDIRISFNKYGLLLFYRLLINRPICETRRRTLHRQI